jgi:hypothetical protein
VTCCTHACNEGRDCPLRNVHTTDGGRVFRDGKVFTFNEDRTETMPAHFRLKRAPDAFAVAMVGVLQWAPVVFFGLFVATFVFLEVWSR